MMTLTYHRRFVPIACLIFMSGMLFTSLSMLLDATPAPKVPAAKYFGKIYALLNVGKGRKSVAHEQYREDVREWFTIPEIPWFLLRFSPAVKLDVVRAQKDAQAWLRKNLHAEYVGKRDMLRVWLSAGSPDEQAIIVDTIVRGYFQHIRRNRIPYLKGGIAQYRRYIASFAQVIVDRETELRKLVNTATLNRSEVRGSWARLCNLGREITHEKKRIAYFRALIERDEALLRTLPHIVKWASQPRPEE